MSIPLDDHAAVYVSATRTRRHRPCIGLVRYFPDAVGADVLLRWAHQLAANPQGFGRRVVGPRLPGARPRWEPHSQLPPIRFEADPLNPAALAELLEDEVSSQPDPARSCGWRIAAARTEDGGTVATLWINHAYGDARAILATAFDPVPEPEAPARTRRPWEAETVRELGDVMQRVRSGVGGSLRLGREAAGAWRRASPPGDLARLAATASLLAARDRSVGARSGRRNLALVHVPAGDWDRVAQAHGGSANTLLLAVLANLLRGARAARGDRCDQPLRILMPVDLRHQQTGNAGDATANAVVGATVVLEGGSPHHGDLGEVRRIIKQALTSAAPAEETRPAKRPAGPAGIVDAMRLLPNTVSHRVAVRAGGADGVASNIGPIPPQVAQLGAHRASHSYLLGGPMMTDVTVCLGRDRDVLTLGFVADAGRLGPGGTLAQRAVEELEAWGVPASPA